MRVLGGWNLYQSKAHPRLPSTSHYKVLLYLTPFGRNSYVKLWPPNGTLLLGVRVDQVGRKWYQSKCRPIFLFDFCTHFRCILHRLATILDAAEQTDRRAGIGRLCYSIGGLMMML